MNRQTDQFLACHNCDALLLDVPQTVNARVSCPRCGSVLTSTLRHSTDGVLVSSICTIVFMGAAMMLPFISLSAGGVNRDAAILDAAAAVGGEAELLAVAVAAMIAAIPVIRALALIYVLLPIRLGGAPAPAARPAFRFAIELRPWSMAEIFIIGVVVALVKVSGLAAVGLGAAFWMFVALAAVAFYEDAVLCQRTVWKMLS